MVESGQNRVLKTYPFIFWQRLLEASVEKENVDARKDQTKHWR